METETCKSSSASVHTDSSNPSRHQQLIAPLHQHREDAGKRLAKRRGWIASSSTSTIIGHLCNKADHRSNEAIIDLYATDWKPEVSNAFMPRMYKFNAAASNSVFDDDSGSDASTEVISRWKEAVRSCKMLIGKIRKDSAAPVCHKR